MKCRSLRRRPVGSSRRPSTRVAVEPSQPLEVLLVEDRVDLRGRPCMFRPSHAEQSARGRFVGEHCADEGREERLGTVAEPLLDGGPDRVWLLRNRLKLRRDSQVLVTPIERDDWAATLLEWFGMTP